MSRIFIRDRNGAVQMVLPGLNVYNPHLRFCGLRDVLVHQKANGTWSVSLVEVQTHPRSRQSLPRGVAWSADVAHGDLPVGQGRLLVEVTGERALLWQAAFQWCETPPREQSCLESAGETAQDRPVVSGECCSKHESIQLNFLLTNCQGN